MIPGKITAQSMAFNRGQSIFQGGRYAPGFPLILLAGGPYLIAYGQVATCPMHITITRPLRGNAPIPAALSS